MNRFIDEEDVFYAKLEGRRWKKVNEVIISYVTMPPSSVKVGQIEGGRRR